MPETVETALEGTFADLANARLRDRCPALLDYLVGFQMIKANDDGSRAVGIFGFEIGEKWHYSPVFFMNGEVKGVDSLYCVDSDLFVPLSEDWTNLIINRRPNQVGTPDTRGRDQRGVRAPNYTRLRTIPSGGSTNIGLTFNKSGAVIDNMLADMPCLTSEELPDLIAGMGAKVASGFIEDLHKYPKLAECVGKFYNLADFYVPTEKKAEAKQDKVIIITSITQDGAADLSEDQKEQLISNGVAVVDKRPDIDKAIVYKNEVGMRLQSPDEGGLYETVMADGKIKDLLIFKTQGDNRFLVFDPEAKSYGLINSEKILTVTKHDKETFWKKFESATSAADDVRNGDTVAFVSTSGSCSLSFAIDSVTQTATSKIYKVKYSGAYEGRWDSAGSTREPQHVLDDAGSAPFRPRATQERIRQIIVTDSPSHQLHYFNNQLVVSAKHFRTLSLGGEQLEFGDFGDHNTIMNVFQKSASSLRVWKDNNEYVVQDEYGTFSLKKTAALSYLINQHKCGADDAFAMLEVETSTPNKYHLKHAADLFAFPDVQDTSESGLMSNFHQTQVPTSVSDRAAPPGNREFYQYQSPYGGFGDDDEGIGEPSEQDQKAQQEEAQSTKGTVETAAQTGQKEVFDAGVLTSLIKSQNPCEYIERYMPTVVAGMDRLGRLMFIINWHYDDFVERYGKSDLMDFLDNMNSTFEALGEIVIFMRKRTLAGDPESYGLGIQSQMEG